MTKPPKARLSSGQRARVTDDGRSPALAGTSGGAPRVVRTGEIREALPLRLVRNIVGMIVLVAALILGIYAVLAVTVLVVLRSDSDNVLVLRGAFPVGQAPAGAFAYASSEPVDYSFMGKVTQATSGVPSGSVVQIVAGPAATISTNADGYIVVNGEATDFHGQVDSYSLTREYVALCVSGKCEPGSAVLIGQDNIVGEVKGYLSLDGFTQPTAPTQN